ncbi:hypothetical protein DNTS_004133 [Danionella cerebrum]|uniref:Uncharacterized protein n=1 Tax=Danionella cerebrum TaxID=2873325 RepID=A0A553REH9_9TELE|nr:hypothetical protein DNTS_004133 [Danionella translucida]
MRDRERPGGIENDPVSEQDLEIARETWWKLERPGESPGESSGESESDLRRAKLPFSMALSDENPAAGGLVDGGLEEEEEECISDATELTAKEEFSAEDSFPADFEPDNLTCEDMEYFCSKAQYELIRRPMFGKVRLAGPSDSAGSSALPQVLPALPPGSVRISP